MKSFPAPASRDCVCFIGGQLISQIGTWVQTAGQSWLVYVTTNSPLKVGLVDAAQFLPAMLLSVFAGLIVDRLPKRQLVLWAEVVSTILAFALGALVVAGRIQYPHVLIASLLSGLARAVENPARQSLMAELVGKESLASATSLNMSVANVARIVGPAIGGLTYEKIGPGWCFIINGISSIPVIVALLVMRRFSCGSVLIKYTVRQASEGFAHVRARPLLLSTAILAAVVNVFAANHSALLTTLAHDHFSMGPRGYGYLSSFVGVGALAGAAVMAVTEAKGVPRPRLLGASGTIIAGLLAALGAFALMRHLPLTIVVLALTGLCSVAFSTIAYSTMQVGSADGYRGQVMSVCFILWSAATPFGSVLTGSLAEAWGAAWAYVLSGIVTAVAAAGVVLYHRRVAKRQPMFHKGRGG